jgi:hypothetical protein
MNNKEVLGMKMENTWEFAGRVALITGGIRRNSGSAAFIQTDLSQPEQVRTGCSQIRRRQILAASLL